MPEIRHPVTPPAIRDTATARLWHRLSQVRMLNIRSLSTLTETRDDKEDISGSGAVTVSESQPGTLVFQEQGAWDRPSGSISFNNKIAWTLVPDTGNILCSHLRYGDDKPEYLAEFAESTDLCWLGIKPYLCADDRYEGSLELGTATLTLTWSVTGPKKSQVISCIYT